MPNISFDIFFDQDFINVSASRGKTAPKAKPEWKVRTAPKLPPKEIAIDPASDTPRPAQREKLTASRKAPPKLNKQKPEKPEVSDAGSQTSEVPQAPRRKPPKLGPKKDTSKE
jgi:hypothetical protein